MRGAEAPSLFGEKAGVRGSSLSPWGEGWGEGVFASFVLAASPTSSCPSPRGEKERQHSGCKLLLPRKLALANLRLSVSASAGGCGWEKGRLNLTRGAGEAGGEVRINRLHAIQNV
jgi:hypothetical protein